jgi:hypothetical protein
MVSIMHSAPDNVAAFSAAGEVNADEFKAVILPECEKKVTEYGELNYLLQLKNDIPDFTVGAWAQDLFLGLKHISNWHRAAIITDKQAIHTITDIFSKLMPGEFKAFHQDQLQEALQWCSISNK